MKSYINILADYHDAPFEKNVTIRCPEDYIASQKKHLTRGFKKTEAVSALEKGDVAVLSLQSEMERFNRPSVFVTVGGGLFDRDFEQKLIGHSVGETFEVTAGDKPVKVTVKQASRTVFPEPTDEMAAAYAAEHDEFADIKTVAAYEAYVVEKYFEEERRDVFFGVMDEVMDYVLTHSDWEFDEAEIKERMDATKAEIRSQLKEEGKEFEALTEEEFQGYFGVSSIEEFEKMLEIEAEREIASDLWLMSIHQKNSVEEIETYPWEFLDKYVKENLKITEER